MKICTYDNPATMSRECWEDGRLLCSYSSKLLDRKPSPLERQPVPGRSLFLGANVGPWKAGQLFGDSGAMGAQEAQG